MCLACGIEVVGGTCPACGGMVVFGGWERDDDPAELLPDTGWDGCTFQGPEVTVPKCRCTVTDAFITLTEGRRTLDRWRIEELDWLAADGAAGAGERLGAAGAVLDGGSVAVSTTAWMQAFLTFGASDGVFLIGVAGFEPAPLRAELVALIGPTFHDLQARAPVRRPPPPDRPPPPPAASAEERLRALARLHADGLVTDEEYAAKRAELIELL